MGRLLLWRENKQRDKTKEEEGGKRKDRKQNKINKNKS